MPVNRADVIVVDKEFQPKTAMDVLYKYKALIVDSLRQNLINADKDQPGKLIQSIDVVIEEQGSVLSFELSMEDYWKYVDQGRKPNSRMPPLKSMLDFIKVRGIKGNPKAVTLKNKTVRKAVRQVNRDKSLKQAAFAIGRSIGKKGIKPTHFASTVLDDELKANLKRDLTVALKRDVIINIKEASL